ncbi:YpoC family protein [Planococcus salinarum]|uniref:YpoC family protein n=1 Tax=Planococcus salinarum TaxID=622695 RepID=UPI000E3E3FCD|nr:hypothetical protein [Planococcus salinarum]TAA66786.1 hypothetical protein D2909_15150 [Planococcus salinarum]
MSTLRKSIEQEAVDPFFISWSRLEQEISVLFRKREGSAALPMKKGIAVYKNLLEQCTTEEERLMPLNNAERLAFVEENSSTFAAFRQLQELFNEMHKKIASRRARLGRI